MPPKESGNSFDNFQSHNSRKHDSVAGRNTAPPTVMGRPPCDAQSRNCSEFVRTSLQAVTVEVKMEVGGSGLQAARRSKSSNNSSSNNNDVQTYPEEISSLSIQLRRPESFLSEHPDVTIGTDVSISGDISFDNLLRVDGKVAGVVSANKEAGVIVGEQGTILGHLHDLSAVLVEGRVVGNIFAVDSLLVRPTGSVFGDICVKSLEIEPNATIVGSVVVSSSPERVAMSDTGDLLDFIVSTTEDIEETNESVPPPRPVSSSKITTASTALVLVAPQGDLCRGAAVEALSEQLAELIHQFGGEEIDEIFVVLETRPRLHVRHGVFWQSKESSAARVVHPTPGTIISSADISNKIWTPRVPGTLDAVVAYVKILEDSGKQLKIQSERCLQANTGHSVLPVINESLQDWSSGRQKTVHYFLGEAESCGCSSRHLAIEELIEHLKDFKRILVFGFYESSEDCQDLIENLAKSWSNSPSKLGGSAPSLTMLRQGFYGDYSSSSESGMLWNHLKDLGVQFVRLQEAFLCTQ